MLVVSQVFVLLALRVNHLVVLLLLVTHLFLMLLRFIERDFQLVQLVVHGVNHLFNGAEEQVEGVEV